jgi:hypothetical protein
VTPCAGLVDGSPPRRYDLASAVLPVLLTVILQTLCLITAGYGLWRLWRFIARRGTLIALIVAAGFAGRSIAGQLLFWVSYLELPFGRSLQLGDGLWFFGLDALSYYGTAKTAALDGIVSIVTLTTAEPSSFYVKAISLFLWLFGIATSTAVLFNLVVYLGTMALIVVWAERRGVDRRIAAVPLAAVSLLPSAVLWSLQPLKDAFVLFLSVLFAFFVDQFVAAWGSNDGRSRLTRIGFPALMLVATTYALAGIRWYYALILIGAASIPLLAIIAAARGPGATLMRATVMLVLMIVLTQNVVASAGPFLPAGMRAVLRPWTEGGRISHHIDRVEAVVEGSRTNLDNYKQAGTRIRAGSAVTGEAAPAPATGPAPAAAATPPAAAPPSPQPQPQPKAEEPKAEEPKAEEPKAEEPPVQTAAAEPAAPVPHTPAPAVVHPPVIAEPAPEPAATVAEPPATTTEAPAPAPQPEPKPKPVTTTAAAPPQAATTTVAPPPAQPAQQLPAPAPVETPASAAVIPAPVPQPQVQVDAPLTGRTRLIVGLAALLLPRGVASGLGLVSIGGGRGMMWFTDVDTILFDALMIACAVTFFIGLRRGAWRDPFLWYLVVATIVIASALAYTISNYGTLFRHRQMVVATLALIGIAAARPRPDATA